VIDSALTKKEVLLQNRLLKSMLSGVITLFKRKNLPHGTLFS
jgi:hypothetical protein